MIRQEYMEFAALGYQHIVCWYSYWVYLGIKWSLWEKEWSIDLYG